jgi:hypothetical protein
VIRTPISLTLALGLLAALAEPSQAGFLTKLGIGAYSGVNIPVVQDDAGTGALYGVRGRIGIPYVTIEPAVTFLDNQDQDVDLDGSTISLEAPSLTSYSFSALFGGAYYGLVGIGWSALEVPDGAGESNEPTYYFGGGAEIGVGPVAIDVSPRLYLVQTADNATRKNVGILIGVNYYFGSLF